MKVGNLGTLHGMLTFASNTHPIMKGVKTMSEYLLKVLNRLWRMVIGIAIGIVMTYIIDRGFKIFEGRQKQ